MIDLAPDQLEIVKNVLEQIVPGRRVVVFGSRAGGRVKPYSDLDLCVMGEEPLSLGTMADLQEAFSESDLPIKVDIVDWTTTEENFRKIIREQAQEL